MISPANGEVSFSDSLCIGSRSLPEAWSSSVISIRTLSVAGWRQYILGIHGSAHGKFDVELTVSSIKRVEAVFLSHVHPFYEQGTPCDAERRIFHEGVIGLDLLGQSEFWWGNVFCRLDKESGQDWIAIVYHPFTSIPLHAGGVERTLLNEQATPSDQVRSRGRDA